MTAAIIAALAITVIAQAIAYERLRRKNLETLAALWASSLDK